MLLYLCFLHRHIYHSHTWHICHWWLLASCIYILRKLRNCILCIIQVQSISFSAGLCKSAFPTCSYVKLGFHLWFGFSCFCIFYYSFFCSMFWIWCYLISKDSILFSLYPNKICRDLRIMLWKQGSREVLSLLKKMFFKKNEEQSQQ